MKKYLFALLLLAPYHAQSAVAPQSQLSQIEAKIKSITAQLLSDESEKDKLYKSLADTEKQIGRDLKELHDLKIKEQEKQRTIQSLTASIKELDKTLTIQQDALAKHLRARHKLGTIHPWQYLLNQDKAKQLSKLFVFYHYLFEADTALITDIKETTQKREAEKALQTEEKEKLLKVRRKVDKRQKNLVLMKAKQQKLIGGLEKQIKTKSDKLTVYRADRIRLQQLITKLNKRQATIQKLYPKEKLWLGSKSLSYPLRMKVKQTRAINQGIVFLAREGAPVLSVLPGKVVFSDWLKGYGLLLILDHGNGLMSLYAHNASLFVQTGMSVTQGQQIATVGHTGGLRENGLYFEVRKRGRAIPPREWMT